MGKYIVKRIISVIPVLFVVSIIVFSLLHLTPGDTASAILGTEASQEDINALNHRLGLDKPIIIQYVDWIGNVFRGDFGTSVASNNEAVSSMIATHFKPTIELAGYALMISVFLALPLGMLAAKFKGTVVD